jgi:hypothetical protein
MSDKKITVLIFGVIFLVLFIFSFSFLFFLKTKNIKVTRSSSINTFSSLITAVDKLFNSTEETQTTQLPSRPASLENVPTSVPSTNETTTTIKNNVNLNQNVTTPTPPAKPVIKPTPKPACTTYTITSPSKLKSSKCYAYQDYVNIQSYYQKYLQNSSEADFAKSGIDITCDNEEFFGDSCKDYKNQLQSAQNDMKKYESLILEIILRN